LEGDVKYETELIIDLPRARVIELFDRFEHLHEWHPGLQGYEHLDGEPGQPGSRTKLIYDEEGRTVEMIETIVERDLPDSLTATYEAGTMYNRVVHRFSEAGPDRTRWQTENAFRFKGLLAVLGFFMRGAFLRQTLQEMNRFKEFAEGA
jgi:hypothetical protein